MLKKTFVFDEIIAKDNISLTLINKYSEKEYNIKLIIWQLLIWSRYLLIFEKKFDNINGNNDDIKTKIKFWLDVEGLNLLESIPNLDIHLKFQLDKSLFDTVSLSPQVYSDYHQLFIIFSSGLEESQIPILYQQLWSLCEKYFSTIFF